MHTIEIPEANYIGYIPEDLSECDSEQYVDMCQLIFALQNQEISLEDFKVHAVYKLLNLKPVEGNDDEEKYSNVSAITHLIDSFFNEENGQNVLKQFYIHNPVPSFKPTFTRYYGPSDSFLDMTFGEYRDALRLFHDFHATGDMHLLSLLTAIFYRKQKPFLWIRQKLSNYDNNPRVAYNSKNLENHAKNFKYAPIGFVYGFYLLFASFQKYLVDAQLMWGGKAIDLSILFQSDSNDEQESIPGIGMDSIAFSMAESGAFGTITEVDKTPFWEIMIRMYDSRRTDLENKKRQENAANKPN